MAVKFEIIITIKPDGEVELKTVGMKGEECEEELKPMEKALGGFSSKEYTKEHNEKSKQKNKITGSTK